MRASTALHTLNKLGRSTGLVGLVMACLLVGGQAHATGCPFRKGEDRQIVKLSVMSDQLNAEPANLAVTALMNAANPVLDSEAKRQLVNGDDRWSGVLTISDLSGRSLSLHEGQRVTVTGYLYRAKCQADGDYHLEVGPSPDRTGPCLIVEAPDPDKIADPQTSARVRSVRNQVEALGGNRLDAGGDPAVHVRFAGALFFDAHHEPAAGQGGGRRGKGFCATNVWELHPVTDLAVGVP